MTVEPPVALFAPQNVATGPARPTEGASAWVAARDDKVPELKLTWNAEVRIGRIIIEFDPDWDHPMESVLMTHPEEVVPFLVRDFEIVDDSGSVLHRVTDNHSGRVEWHWQQPLSISNLTIRILATHGCPAAIFRVCCLAR